MYEQKHFYHFYLLYELNFPFYIVYRIKSKAKLNISIDILDQVQFVDSLRRKNQIK